MNSKEFGIPNKLSEEASRPLLRILSRILLGEPSPNLPNTMMFQCEMCNIPVTARLLLMGQCIGHRLKPTTLTIENIEQSAKAFLNLLEYQSDIIRDQEKKIKEMSNEES